MTSSILRVPEGFETPLDYAESFPSMGGREIGGRLECLAAAVPAGQAIVEVGSWLGSGTAHLALGANYSGAPIHCFDRWRANEEEAKKAREFGIPLERGQDTLPWVEERLEPFGAEIHYHKGRLLDADWRVTPIGLYVDDASKSPQLWRKAARTFLPYVPVGGFLVLMDYFFFEKRGARYKAQYRWMATRQDQFRLVEDHVGGTTTAIFERIA